MAGMRQFRQGVGDATGTNIMDGKNGVVRPHLPATVDDFLRPTLNFRVAALYRGEIEVFGIDTSAHRRGGAAAQANQHAGAAELHKERADRESFDLEGLIGGNIAQATGNHDRLMVTPYRADYVLLVAAEIARQIGTAKFVIESGRANRAFEHDVECRGNARGFAVRLFPRLRRFRQIEIGNGETTQTSLGFGAAARRAFITNFAAGTGRSAGKGRNGGRVVVRFNLGQNVGQFVAKCVAAIGLRVEARNGSAFDDRRIVGVGHHRALRMSLMRFTDHAEQGLVLRLAVDDPRGVENLVTAMLGIGLREHHQLNVSRVAARLGKNIEEIVDFIFRQRQPQTAIGHHQRGTATGQYIDGRERLGRKMAKQFASLVKAR
ncbi:MAG: hypothetical protein BWY57_00871 [Betaproteobacteria bacterium ADurb.Bin341]|nr:MAG: hypothetical protein BWY57_00871 [Betaproteobacteria bacterium ADurb.Bin341]